MVDDFGIGIEIGVHGRQWHAVHDGYFADPEVVLPFLDTINLELRTKCSSRSGWRHWLCLV